MKIPYLLLLFISLSMKFYAQDTCVYVSNQNQLGGLDCALMSIAPYTADSFQWLNCDSSYSIIAGQTTGFYSGSYDGNIALEVTYLGCVDTSACYHTCNVGIEEFKNTNKKLLKILNCMGVESEDKPNTLLIHIYSDGTKKKVFRVE